MERPDMNSAFTNVDQAADPTHFVSHLDRLTAMDAIRTYKERTFALLNPREGSRFLDIGCGPGDDAQALAHLVGSTGNVIGIDHSATMIAEAEKRVAALGLPVEYRVGDAYALPFADNTFDGCRADRVLHHLDRPEVALAELARVARSGASIVIMEPDFEAMILDSPDRPLTRTLFNFHCDTVRNGWMGRRLPAMFKEVGLRAISVEPLTVLLPDYGTANGVLWLERTAAHAQEAGIVSATETAEWLENLRAADRAGCFFGAVSGFIVSGKKP